MKEISIVYFDKKNNPKYKDSVNDVKEMYFCNTFEMVVNNRRTPLIINWIIQGIKKTQTKSANIIFHSDNEGFVCAINIYKKLFGFKVVFIDGKDIELGEGFGGPDEDFE